MSTYRAISDPPLPNYSRDHFPNVSDLERAVAELEGAEDGYAVASGMAAIALVFISLLKAGDHVVIADGSYCDTESLLLHVLSRFQVDFTAVAFHNADDIAGAMTSRTRIVFVETIANPSMRVVDLAKVARIAHAGGALLVVDNTFATPLYCQPLTHGADLVVHSATKFLGGHHDLTAGLIVGSRSLIQAIRESGYLIGSLPGAVDSWLALRGIRTLAPRMAWISDSAMKVAIALAEHPLVSEVSYPGLATGEDREIVDRMLVGGYSGMIRFQLAAGQPGVDLVLRSLQLIVYAGSLGGTTTTICYPPSRQHLHDPCMVGDGCLRLSIGLESPEDIIGDLINVIDLTGAMWE